MSFFTIEFFKKNQNHPLPLTFLTPSSSQFNSIPNNPTKQNKNSIIYTLKKHNKFQTKLPSASKTAFPPPNFFKHAAI